MARTVWQVWPASPNRLPREVALEDAYSCEDAAVRAFVAKLLDNSNSAKAEFISIYCPVVQGKTYMTAVVFRNNKA